MNITFVLVEPVVPENVGAAARALKTMGFSRLRLVNSAHHQHERAQWLAHGSHDVLAQAQGFPDLNSALADIDLAIGTSAKPRHNRRSSLEPKDVRQLIATKGDSVQQVAIVFGREDRGLSNEEVALCDLVTSVPLVAPYPSLNLAQAVMLYAWELSSLRPPTDSSQLPGHSAADRCAPEQSQQYRALRSRVSSILNQLHKVPDSKLYDWAMERLALLHEKDIHFMHTLCQSLERVLPDQPPSEAAPGHRR